MPDEKLNRLEKWIANNSEKALALIEKHTTKGEEVLYYVTAKTGPHYLLIFKSIIGRLIELSKENYLLAVTRNNFLMISIRKFGIEEIACKSIPVGTIRESVVKKFPLSCNLRLVLSDGKRLLFKDLTYDSASSLKDAIESVQSSRLEMEPEQAESQEGEPGSISPSISPQPDMSLPVPAQGAPVLLMMICPFCKMKVLPKSDGTCPSCQSKISP